MACGASSFSGAHRHPSPIPGDTAHGRCLSAFFRRWALPWSPQRLRGLDLPSLRGLRPRNAPVTLYAGFEARLSACAKDGGGRLRRGSLRSERSERGPRDPADDGNVRRPTTFARFPGVRRRSALGSFLFARFVLSCNDRNVSGSSS